MPIEVFLNHVFGDVFGAPSAIAYSPQMFAPVASM